MNIFRELLARAVEDNGGYYGSRRERWPLSFAVGLYYADLDRAHMEALAVQDHGVTKAQIEASRPLVAWNPEREWTDVQQQMYDGLNDDDGNRTYSPATATRFGLPFERFPKTYKRRTGEGAYFQAAIPGWVIEDPYTCRYYDVEFQLRGRSGKHLVINEFRGRDLHGLSSERLAEILRSDEEMHSHGITNVWCHALLAMITEWTERFTSRNASAEMEYLAADQFAQRVNEALSSDEFASRQFRARNDLCTSR